MPHDAAIFADCAALLVAVGHELYRQGWSPATSSNYSMRLDSDSCAITVSGKHKGRLTVRDIMSVDLDGQPLMDAKPSAETLLHTQLYRFDDAIGAVLHTHSPHATVLSRYLAARDHLVLAGYELLKAFRSITTHDTTMIVPIFDNTQDIPALAQQVSAYLSANPACCAYIIRGHGVYTWGATLDDCLRHLEALEFLFCCEVQSRQLERSE